MIHLLHRWALAHRSPAFSATFAIVAVTLSFILRYVLEGSLPDGFPYVTFFPAVILTTFFAGFRAGTAAAITAGLLAWYFFIDPRNSFALTWNSALALGFFAVILAVDIVIIHVMAMALRGVAEERARSERLATSRDLMFRELQHRISNNLAVVGSLLKIQRRKVRDVAARRALDAATARLNLVAKIQRELHDPATQSVDLSRFLQDMAGDIVTSAAAGDRISTTVQSDAVWLDSERAIPVALICTELLSNAVEHGFEQDARGLIQVRLVNREDGSALLEVEDDGAGLPEGFDLEKAEGLGLTIARQLADQIGASLTMQPVEKGVVSRLAFRIAPQEACGDTAAPAAELLASFTQTA